MSEGKQFVNGLIVKAPHQKAPEYVKCNISIKKNELMAFLMDQKDEWVNIDVKESKGGKWYAEVSQWKPKSTTPAIEQEPAIHTTQEQEEINLEEDIPF